MSLWKLNGIAVRDENGSSIASCNVLSVESGLFSELIYMPKIKKIDFLGKFFSIYFEKKSVGVAFVKLCDNQRHLREILRGEDVR